MTDRERQFASLGFEYCEGTELASTIIVPSTGREIRKTADGWECQPPNDNYWREFDDLLDAIKFASRPQSIDAQIEAARRQYAVAALDLATGCVKVGRWGDAGVAARRALGILFDGQRAERREAQELLDEEQEDIDLDAIFGAAGEDQ